MFALIEVKCNGLSGKRFFAKTLLILRISEGSPALVPGHIIQYVERFGWYMSRTCPMGFDDTDMVRLNASGRHQFSEKVRLGSGMRVRDRTRVRRLVHFDPPNDTEYIVVLS